MLDKLVIHLKNIIFFKLIVYLICIILLAALIPRLQGQLAKSVARKEKAEILFNQSATQLNSIIEFEEKIYETNLKYKDLFFNSSKKSCDTRTELFKNLALLSEKYNLYEPIKAKVVRVFEMASIQNKNSDVKLHQHEVTINFAVNSNAEVLNLSNDIYAMLPDGSMLISMQIKKLQVITPAIIEKLSTKRSPSFIDVSIKVLLREIVYEK